MQDTIDLEKYFEKRKILLEFDSFFSLPDGVEEIGSSWKDSKGNFVDLNDWSLNHIQKVPAGKSKKLTESISENIKRKLLNVLFKAAYHNYPGYTIKDNRHYSNGIEIFRKPFTMHKTKYASTTEDFELIFQRELKKANCKDTDADAFRELLINKILRFRNNKRIKNTDEGLLFTDLVHCADEFIKWIKVNDKQKRSFEEKKSTLKRPLTFEEWFNDSLDIEFAIEAMKHFKVIDENENYIEPVYTQCQYLFGLIDGLQTEKKIKKGSLNTIYKCFCEKINRPYIAIKRPSKNNGSANINGKTEMIEYITSHLL